MKVRTGSTPNTNRVIPALVAGIQPSSSAGASGKMDPGDEHRDDKCVATLVP